MKMFQRLPGLVWWVLLAGLLIFPVSALAAGSEPTTIDLYIAPTYPAYGDSVYMLATVTAVNSNVGMPDGTLEFYKIIDGLDVLIETKTLHAEQADCTFVLESWVSKYKAVYIPDSSSTCPFATSTKEWTTNALLNSVHVEVGTAPGRYLLGESVQLIATVDETVITNQIVGIEGRMEFFYAYPNDPYTMISLGKAPIIDGVATLSTTAIPDEHVSLNAKLYRVNGYSEGYAPRSFSYFHPGTITLNLQPGGTQFNVGDTVYLTLNIDSPVYVAPLQGTLNFYDNGTLFATMKTDSDYYIRTYLQLTQEGVHDITVSFVSDNGNHYPSTSQPVRVNAVKGDFLGKLSLAPAAPVAGEKATLTFTITSPTGKPIGPGTVDFYSNGKKLGSSGLINGAASYVVPSLAAGDYLFEAYHTPAGGNTVYGLVPSITVQSTGGNPQGPNSPVSPQNISKLPKTGDAFPIEALVLLWLALTAAAGYVGLRLRKARGQSNQ